MMQELQKGVKKRKAGNENSKFKKSRKGKKLRRASFGADDVRVKNMDKRMKKIFQKKARDYNSDDDDVGDEEKEKDLVAKEGLVAVKDERKGGLGVDFSNDEEDGEEDGEEQNEVSEDEDGYIQPGILRFSEGCKAFRLAFKKITKKTASTDDDILGPVLSAHKKLVVEKLAEEEAERKVKSEAKKEKHRVGEKGHVKPANYLDPHEKLLIGLATRGVVKLFNAVNKAQHAQKGLNPSRSIDEKVIKKRRKEAFFSVLGQAPSKQAGTVFKGKKAKGAKKDQKQCKLASIGLMQQCTIGKNIPDDWSGQMKQTICLFRRSRRDLQLSRRNRLQIMNLRSPKMQAKMKDACCH